MMNSLKNRILSLKRFFVSRGVAALVFGIVVLSVSGFAQADLIDDLAERLKNSNDFRIQTQAALALGSSQDQRAVEPLCGGLKDENSTVRVACATALGRLDMGGLECLESHLQTEDSDTVKAAIEKSIALLKENQDEDPIRMPVRLRRLPCGFLQ
jgi:HEAT repeat protein